jgi:hypothetical protein
MRFDDAVYVLSSGPQPRPLPTRRMFLLIGGAFLGGTAVGGACGYSIGVARGESVQQPAGPETPAKPAAGEEPELGTSGDIELDELRRLAIKAPLDDLFEKASMFLTMQLKHYKDDPILWRGVERMSREILDNKDKRFDQLIIGVVIQNIRYLEPPPELGLRERMPALQARRTEERRR